MPAPPSGSFQLGTRTFLSISAHGKSTWIWYGYGMDEDGYMNGFSLARRTERPFVRNIAYILCLVPSQTSAWKIGCKGKRYMYMQIQRAVKWDGTDHQNWLIITCTDFGKMEDIPPQFRAL